MTQERSDALQWFNYIAELFGWVSLPHNHVKTIRTALKQPDAEPLVKALEAFKDTVHDTGMTWGEADAIATKALAAFKESQS